VDKQEIDRSFLLLLFSGILGTLLSQPVIFVLTGISLSYAVRYVQSRSKAHFSQWALLTILCGSVFILVFQIHIRPSMNNAYLTSYWQAGFPEFPPTTFEELDGLLGSLYKVLQDPVGLSLTGGSFLLAYIGAVQVVGRSKPIAAIVLGPLIISFVAGSLRLYPFQGRVVLFLAPSLILLVATGIETLISHSSRMRIPILIGLIPILIYPSIKDGIDRGVSPRPREEMRPVVHYLHSKYLEGDKIYVYTSALPAYQYYSIVTGRSDVPYSKGLFSREEPALYLKDVENLCENPRVWVVFSHVYTGEMGNEEHLITEHLDSIGQDVITGRFPGASIYLYDLSNCSAE
jgi:hypothetical protein